MIKIEFLELKSRHVYSFGDFKLIENIFCPDKIKFLHGFWCVDGNLKLISIFFLIFFSFITNIEQILLKIIIQLRLTILYNFNRWIKCFWIKTCW